MSSSSTNTNILIRVPIQYKLKTSEAVDVAYPDFTRTREIFSVFVEAYGHHSVCSIECFFYAISMVDINIDVQNPLMIP